MSGIGFAFIDLETTGLDVRGKDRIIEIAIVLADENLRVEREYETLVNPGRDVGPTSIHGITASDVLPAPKFSDLASTVAQLLQGRVVVGHNVRFDTAMLDAEFKRLGHSPRWGNPVCTMLCASSVFSGKLPRKLTQLTASLGIEHELAHSALADAKACFEVALKLEVECPGVIRFSAVDDVFECEIPKPSSLGVSLPRQVIKSAQEMSFVQALVARVPSGYSGAKNLEYFELLDKVLADFRIDEGESGQLISVAENLGLLVEDLDQAHKAYVRELSIAAKADGVVTDTERKQIYRVAELLGVSALFVEQNLSMSVDEAKSDLLSHRQGTVLGRGNVVLLTGDMDPNKGHFESIFEAHGLVIASGISRKVDALFAGDPASQSGKANKARQLGIPIFSVYDWELYVA